MESIRISIIQTDIVWENKQENLRLLHEKLQSLRGITENVVLPEPCRPDIKITAGLPFILISTWVPPINWINSS